jgi:hypothetical protein
VLIGLGLAIFFIWRFQMKQLIRNMDKKANWECLCSCLLTGRGNNSLFICLFHTVDDFKIIKCYILAMLMSVSC